MKNWRWIVAAIALPLSGGWAQASWISFNVNRITTPLDPSQVIAITDLAGFQVPALTLSGDGPGAIRSFRNDTGRVLNDFHLVMTCRYESDQPPDISGECNGGQGFGPHAPASDIFATMQRHGLDNPHDGPAGSITWWVDFSGGEVAPGGQFGIFDDSGGEPATYEVTARASVPEPGSLLLVSLALGGLAWSSRRPGQGQRSPGR